MNNKYRRIVLIMLGDALWFLIRLLGGLAAILIAALLIVGISDFFDTYLSALFNVVLIGVAFVMLYVVMREVFREWYRSAEERAREAQSARGQPDE